MRSFINLIFFSLFAATAVKSAILSRAVEKYNGDTSGQCIVQVK
jgi:hypothetical protein